MKSSVIERSSSFEDALSMALKKTIADRQPLSDREFANLSAAIRLFVLGFYRDQQGEPILPIISGGTFDH
jgi:hypothetical protein